MIACGVVFAARETGVLPSRALAAPSRASMLHDEGIAAGRCVSAYRPAGDLLPIEPHRET